MASEERDRTVERRRKNGTLAVTDDAAIKNYVDVHLQWWLLETECDGLASLVHDKITQTMDEDGNVTTHRGRRSTQWWPELTRR